MSDYDAFADTYENTINERSDRACVLVPTVRHYLGDLTGLRVVDLACGAGYFTRYLKAWGAAKVVGVDISREMIALARKEEAARPLGIEYQEGDVTRLGSAGEFDVVLASFLLHYAASVDELHGMCRSVAASLGPQGRLVALNENPFHPIHDGMKYDVVARPEGPLRDGVKVTRTHFSGGREILSFTHYHYEPATYEKALRAAGLSAIEWVPFVKGPRADEGYPPGYWDEFCGDFSARVLLARREPS